MLPLAVMLLAMQGLPFLSRLKNIKSEIKILCGEKGQKRYLNILLQQKRFRERNLLVTT
jgi:hypothetical protein